MAHAFSKARDTQGDSKSSLLWTEKQEGESGSWEVAKAAEASRPELPRGAGVRAAGSRVQSAPRARTQAGAHRERNSQMTILPSD